MVTSYEIPESVTLRRARVAAATWATVISLLYVSGTALTDRSISFWAAGLLWVVTYVKVHEVNSRVQNEEPSPKLQLSESGIRFIWPGNESELKFENVESIFVRGTMAEPQSLLFRMKSGERHEIKRYEGIREMHLHAQSKLPLSIFDYEDRILPTGSASSRK